MDLRGWAPCGHPWLPVPSVTRMDISNWFPVSSFSVPNYNPSYKPGETKPPVLTWEQTLHTGRPTVPTWAACLWAGSQWVFLKRGSPAVPALSQEKPAITPYF